MARTGITLTGTNQLLAALTKAAAVSPPALAAAALEEMEEVMAEAKAQTPVRDGVLRDSGHVLPPEYGSDGVEIVAGFGGAASDYAIVQHERLDYNHPVGNSKFLERPFMARFATIPRKMAASAALALRTIAGGR